MLERRKAEAVRALETRHPMQAAPRPGRGGDAGGLDAGATEERAKSLDAFSTALAHRLMGRSIFFPERDPDCVGIRFDTCFGGASPEHGVPLRRVPDPRSAPSPPPPGTFCEQYYVILETRPSRGLSLRSHTLPPFLPVEALARSMLPDRVVVRQRS